MRSLVTGIGGDIAVSSRRHAGTTFTVTLQVPSAEPPAERGEAEIREFRRQVGITPGAVSS